MATIPGTTPDGNGAGASCPVPTRLLIALSKLGHLLPAKPNPADDPTEVAAGLLETLSGQNQQLRKALEGATERLRLIPLLSDRKAALPVFYKVVSQMPDDDVDHGEFRKLACIHLVNWLNESQM